MHYGNIEQSHYVLIPFKNILFIKVSFKDLSFV